MSRQIREVKVKDIFTYALIPPVVAAALWLPSVYLIYPKISHGWVLITAISVVSYFLLKRFLIGLVLLYKAFAPMEIRDQCRFIPTCSTYMILAIKKYGIILGVLKGLHRICRCRPPNGGIDYP